MMVAGIVAVIGAAAAVIGLPFLLSWHDSRPAVRARLYYTPLDGPPVPRSQLCARPAPAPGPGCGAVLLLIGIMVLTGFAVGGAIGGLLGLIVGVWAAFVVGGLITHTVDS